MYVVSRPKFHFFSPGFLLENPYADNEFYAVMNWIERNDPYLRYGIDNCCAKTSIAFHNIEPIYFELFDDFLYR